DAGAAVALGPAEDAPRVHDFVARPGVVGRGPGKAAVLPLDDLADIVALVIEPRREIRADCQAVARREGPVEDHLHLARALPALAGGDLDVIALKLGHIQVRRSAARAGRRGGVHRVLAQRIAMQAKPHLARGLADLLVSLLVLLALLVVGVEPD